MKIFLVDNNSAFRKNLRIFLEEYLNCEISGEASSGQEFLDQVSQNTNIVLMDINMPGIDGIEATKLGVNKLNNLKIIAVSQYKEIADLQVLICSGIKGFVSKTDIFDNLELALNKVNDGGYFFPDYIPIK